jgi:hypothetical protein
VRGIAVLVLGTAVAGAQTLPFADQVNCIPDPGFTVDASVTLAVAAVIPLPGGIG